MLATPHRSARAVPTMPTAIVPAPAVPRTAVPSTTVPATTVPATIAAIPARAPRVAPTRDATSIRIGPVPRTEPPTDDELREAGWDPPASGMPTLPLNLPRSQPPARPAGFHHPVIAPPGQVPPNGRVSPARLATRLFLATCLEIVGGYRPVTHLRPFCRPEQFPDIANQVTGQVTNPPGRFRGRAYGVVRMPGSAPPGTRKPAGTARPVAAERVVLRRVQTSEAVAGAIEVAVVLTRSDQVWAMAFRLEEWRGRWVCSCLEVL
jgi:Family of unknown function (DUF6459)